MKSLSFLSVIFGISLIAQQPPPLPELPPDTVVATIDGRKLLWKELEAYLNGLGPEQKAAALGSSREQLVLQYGLQLRILAVAAQDKLQDLSPYKEAIEVSRRYILTEAEINYKALHTQITPDEQKKFYESHKDRYNQVQLQEIYLGFTSDAVAKENPKKYRNEAQTLALAKKLRVDAKTGDDFVRLVKQYSEDESSKAKNGDFGVVKASDNVPAEIKAAVFALKDGQVSEPIQQQNGYYLFRAKSVGLRPYDEIKDDIYKEIQNLKMQQWIEGLQKSVVVSDKNSQFFSSSPATKQ